MPTPDEIRRRVEQADAVRSARRAAAAQRIGELALRRADVAAQLEDVERELGGVLSEAQDVIGVDELAQVTDLKAADLTGWLANRTAHRGKRRKSVPAGGTRDDAGRTSRPRALAPRQPSAAVEGAAANVTPRLAEDESRPPD